MASRRSHQGARDPPGIVERDEGGLRPADLQQCPGAVRQRQHVARDQLLRRRQLTQELLHGRRRRQRRLGVRGRGGQPAGDQVAAQRERGLRIGPGALHELLGGRQLTGAARHVAAGEGHRGADHRRLGAGHVGRQVGQQPGEPARARPGQEVRDAEPVDQHPHRRPPLAGGGRVHRGLGRLAGAQEPRRGPPAQLLAGAGGVLLEPGPQHLLQQRVVVVAVEVLLAAGHERVVAGEVGEQAGRALLPGQLLGETGGQVVGDARPDQEPPHRRRVRPQDLLVDVLVQVARGRDVAGRPGGLVRIPQGQAGEDQAGHPAPGPAQDPVHGLGPGRQPLLLEQGGRLGRGGGQVGGPDLGHRAGQPVARQRDRGVVPGEHDQPQRGPGVPEQEVQLAAQRRVGHDVGVVQHHDDRLGPLVEGGGQADEEGRIQPVRMVGRRHARRSHPRPRQRGQQVGPEDPGLPVQRVEADPDHRPGGQTGLDPGQHQSGLAAAGGCADDGEPALRSGRHPLQQPRPTQRGRRQRRHVQLGEHQRVASGTGRNIECGTALDRVLHGDHPVARPALALPKFRPAWGTGHRPPWVIDCVRKVLTGTGVAWLRRVRIPVRFIPI